MDRSTLTFKVLGFSVEVQATFWLLVAINALQGGGGWLLVVGWVVALFAGVLVHELGHALTARALGIEVGTIQLYGLGGLVSHGRTTPGRQLLISLAGPFAGAALGIACGGIALAVGVPPAIQYALVEPMLLVTLFYGLVNLLPGLPLDGGNALQAALTPLLGSAKQARTITAYIGLALGVGLIGVAVFDEPDRYVAGFLALMLVSFNWAVVRA